METEPDEMQAARIGALLGEMEAQRASGQLPFAAAPLRLFGVGGGRFVRVLDEHEEPLSPRSARRELWSPIVDDALCADTWVIPCASAARSHQCVPRQSRGRRWVLRAAAGV
jgi:hypothetical protein